MIRKILLLAAALTTAGIALLTYRKTRVTRSARKHNASTDRETNAKSTEQVDISADNGADFREEAPVFPEGSIKKGENEGLE